MSILNYFFIGTAFAFIIELLLGIEVIKNHPKLKDKSWGWFERISVILLWPIAFIIFSISFLRTYFRK